MKNDTEELERFSDSLPHTNVVTGEFLDPVRSIRDTRKEALRGPIQPRKGQGDSVSEGEDG